MNRIYREGGKDLAEVDVLLIVKNRRIRFIECKGILPGNLLSDEEVEKWLNKRIPVVLAQTRKDNVLSKLDHRFELWVTGELTAEAKGMIAAAQALAALKSYSIAVFYAADIEQQVRSLNDPSLRKVIDQHFLRAPMAFPDSVINPLSKRSISQGLFGFDDVNTEAAVTLPEATPPALPTR